MTAPRRLALPDRYDLARTVGALALVPGDPTVVTGTDQTWWATRTPDGPGTLRLRRTGSELHASGYGPGAGWLLDRADAVAGLRDDLGGFLDVAARHPVVHRLATAHSGVRLPATGRVFHHLVPAILGQKVTRVEATRGYLGLVQRLPGGSPAPAPGPAADSAPGRPPRLRLRLPPDAGTLAATPYWVLHRFGVEQRRANTIARAAGYADRLDAATDSAQATRLMTTLPGIGPWTAAEVVRVAHGDADAVSVGDLHLPHAVSYLLAGEPRGDDARMLELLEPFRGHRGRVCRLLLLGGVGAPRFGPRHPVRSFAAF